MQLQMFLLHHHIHKHRLRGRFSVLSDVCSHSSQCARKINTSDNTDDRRTQICYKNFVRFMPRSKKKKCVEKASDFEMTVNFQRVTTHIFQFLGLASQCFSLLSFFSSCFSFHSSFQINTETHFFDFLEIFPFLLSVRTSFVYMYT